jgi:hypothetical protein
VTPEPGIHFGVDFADYLKWNAFSKSGLPALAESPAQYLFWLQSQDDFIQTDPMIVGSAVDTLVFDGLEMFHATYFRLPEGVQRRPGTVRFNIELLRGGGKIPLPATMWDRVFAIADAIQSEPDVAAMIERSQTQVSWLWQEPRTEVLVKGRLDMWDRPWIGDLKITVDITPRGWRRQVRRLRHDWQAALYCEAMTALTGETHDRWSWITARDKPVHSVQIYDLEQIDLVESWIEIVEHLQTYKICKDNNHWPANSGARQSISVRRRP